MEKKLELLAYDIFKMKTKDRQLLQQIGTKFREIDEQVWMQRRCVGPSQLYTRSVNDV